MGEVELYKAALRVSNGQVEELVDILNKLMDNVHPTLISEAKATIFVVEKQQLKIKEMLDEY